jgi:hypothetical protein
MNKITIFNENYVYLEMVRYNQLRHIYINKHNLKPSNEEDEKLVETISKILFNRLNLSEEYFYYFYKIIIESQFRYISFVYHLITNEQKYYEVIYNIYLKDKSIIEKYREILTPRVIINLLENNKIIS